MKSNTCRTLINYLLSRLHLLPILAIALSCNLQAAPFGLEEQILPSTQEVAANFGISTAIDGDTAVVGAHNEDKADATPGNYGAVYVYQRQAGNTWSQVAKLIARTTITGTPDQRPEAFGWSVAIKNELIVVGAPRSSFTTPDTNLSAGRVFVFKKTAGTWSTIPIAVLDQNDPVTGMDNKFTGAQFGYSVDVANPAGNQYSVVVGAWGDLKDIDPITEAAPVPVVENAGSIYLYDYPDITIDASVTPNTLRSAAIGATAKLTDLDGKGGTSSTNYNDKTGDTLGNSVAISANGNTVVAGAFGDQDNGPNASDQDAGTVLVWQKPAGGWTNWDHLGNGNPGIMPDPMPVTRELSFDSTLTSSLTVNSGMVQAGDRFGNSVDISNDGGVIVVGARGFDDDPLANSTANAQGRSIGAILLFEETDLDWGDNNAGTLRMADELLVDNSADRLFHDRLGTSVSLAPDGSMVVAGLNDYFNGHSGRPEKVLAWNKPGSGWIDATVNVDLFPDQTLIATDYAFDCAVNPEINDQSCDYFGGSKSNAVATDGSRIIIGAGGHNIDNVRTLPRNDQGRAYIFADISGAVNTPPVATADSIVINEDTASATIVLAGTDANGGDVLDYTVVSRPTNGVLSGDPSTSNLVYTPDANYTGGDSFIFRAHDATEFSADATITITVTAVPDLPVATPQTVITSEDTAVGITLEGTDPDLEAVDGFIVETNPTNGALSGTAPNLTYTPTTGFIGSDSFTFKVSNVMGGPNVSALSATVDIVVNDVPVVDAAQSFPIEENSVATTAVGTVAKTDTIFEAIAGYTYSIISGNESGFFDIDAATGAITVAAIADLDAETTAVYSLAVRLNDGYIDSATDEIVTINVTDRNEFVPVITSPNPNPLAFNLSDSTLIGSTIQTMVVTDGDAAPTINFSLQDTFTGTFAIDMTTGQITVEAALDASTVPTSYSLKADAFDGITTVTATYNITLVSTPVAINQIVNATEDIAIEITLAGNDSDGLPNPLTYSIDSPPDAAKGSLGPINNVDRVTFTPAANFNGQATFTFKVNDGAQDSNTATVTINVAPADDLPTANNQTVTAVEDISIEITLAGNDSDSDPLTFSIVSQPDVAKGALDTISNLNKVTFTPVADFNGQATFTFKVNDGTSDSNSATVTINIAAVNDAPVATDQSATTPQDTPIDVNVPASDVDGDTLTYTAVTNPSGGTLSSTGLVVTYTPNSGFNGVDTFTYNISDGTDSSNTATITITVAAASTSSGGGGSLSVVFLISLLLLLTTATLLQRKKLY